MVFQTPNQRLLSLDILRGFDLFVLVFFQPVFVSLVQTLDLPFADTLLYHFDHEDWVGFRAWDLVMPLFLFMSGVSMPFAFSKYEQMSDKSLVYRRIGKRVVLLFLLGAVVQGNLLAFDLHQLRLYSNTLQAIAIGYLIASLIFLNFSFKGQLIAGVVLLLLYWLPMTFLGDFTPEGNFAEKVDRLMLGRFRDGVSWGPDGHWSFSPHYQYTWIVSSLTFGVTVLMGTIAGGIIKGGSQNRNRTALILFLSGVGCILVSLLWSLQMPIIKKVWTCSMTLYSGGWCLLLMAFFYYIVDCRGYSTGLKWLKIYGMNAITAYVLGQVINFRSVVESVSFGFEQFMGVYYKTWVTFGNYSILFLILYILYKRNIFLRI